MNQVLQGDCLELMAGVKKGSVDLIFADPPFNIGFKYDTYEDRLEAKEYERWCYEWIDACGRCLKPDGSLYIAIGDEFAAQIKTILDKTRMSMRNWIIWHYTFGVHCQTKFGRDHAHIFYYVNDPKNFHWDGDAVRIQSARQEQGDKRADPRGRVPGDVWTESRLCGNFQERTEHPCQMPLPLLERIIKASSAPGDLVMDPFGGSGTTAVAASMLGRNYLTMELSPTYCEIIKLRLGAVNKELFP